MHEDGDWSRSLYIPKVSKNIVNRIKLNMMKFIYLFRWEIAYNMIKHGIKYVSFHFIKANSLLTLHCLIKC